MSFYELIFLIAVCGYFIQTIIFMIGMQKKFPKIKEEKIPTATIIVAARNEEENILRCLQSLDALIYPEGKLQIIIVNDKSTDRTDEIIEEFVLGKPKFKKITTSKEIGNLKGKTNAIANAIELATGEIILTSDADCAVSPTWAKTIASYYQEDVAIVNGFTSQKVLGSFSGMQNLDFIYLLSVASGTINLNKPLSCIGNNMSYRKSAYFEIGGYESLPFSVTEDFNLLFAIHNLKKYKIIFPFDTSALVESLACPDIKSLYRQKKRWGVGGLKSPLRSYFVMASAFISHLAIILLPFFFTTTALTILLFKLFIDFFFLYNVLKQLNLVNTLKHFFSFQLYYILYVVFLPIVVLLNQKVVWKGREY
ncbi:MAG: glycosyl transferase [Chlorobiaceae bacterium]|nr:glycosyl transferase [Chlorobiaceae bacterium]MBA4308929.1 glycosyl transferase [Chlorobiaceae bacterium]